MRVTTIITLCVIFFMVISSVDGYFFSEIQHARRMERHIRQMERHIRKMRRHSNFISWNLGYNEYYYDTSYPKEVIIINGGNFYERIMMNIANVIILLITLFIVLLFFR